MIDRAPASDRPVSDLEQAFLHDRERWIEMMKESIAQLAPRFSMHRAVVEYVERYYQPAHAGARV